MSVLEFVRTTAVEGKADELRAALETAIPGFPEQPGCRSAKAFQAVDSEDPHVFFLVIEWDSKDVHLAWRDSGSDHRALFSETVRPLMSGDNLTGHYVEFVDA